MKSIKDDILGLIVAAALVLGVNDPILGAFYRVVCYEYPALSMCKTDKQVDK